MAGCHNEIIQRNCHIKEGISFIIKKSLLGRITMHQKEHKEERDRSGSRSTNSKRLGFIYPKRALVGPPLLCTKTKAFVRYLCGNFFLSPRLESSDKYSKSFNWISTPNFITQPTDISMGIERRQVYLNIPHPLLLLPWRVAWAASTDFPGWWSLLAWLTFRVVFK